MKTSALAKAGPPSKDGATQAGGHAAQVDRAPLGKQRTHAADDISRCRSRECVVHHAERYPSSTSLAVTVISSPVLAGLTLSSFMLNGSAGMSKVRAIRFL